jgi:hypothetical protein
LVGTVEGVVVSRANRRASVAIDSRPSLSGNGAPSRLAGALPRHWRLGPRTVLFSLATIAVADLVIWRWHPVPYGVEALFDEPAHIATGLLGLGAVGASFTGEVLLAVLAGSLLIDLDHLPRVFGSHIFDHGLPRPYTHSLGTLVVLLAVYLLIRDRRWRLLVAVAAMALALHFFRDMAEPGGSGVSLLWPISNHALTIPYPWYGGVVAVLASLALLRASGRDALGSES